MQKPVWLLRTNAAQYNLNLHEVAVFGQSAGGNPPLWWAKPSASPILTTPICPAPAVSSKLRIVIDWFGLAGFLQMAARAQGCSASPQAHNAASSLGLK